MGTRHIETMPAWASRGSGRPPARSDSGAQLRAHLELLSRQGVTCVAYGPLGHGKEGLLTHPEIEKIAEEVGKTPAQVRGSPRLLKLICSRARLCKG